MRQSAKSNLIIVLMFYRFNDHEPNRGITALHIACINNDIRKSTNESISN